MIVAEIVEATRAWARKGSKVTRKYRCTYGPRKGRTMSSPSACNAPINVKKSVGLKSTKAKRQSTINVRSKITRRTNPASKRLTTVNKPRSSPFGRKKFK